MKLRRLAVLAMTSMLVFAAVAPVLAAGNGDHDRGRPGWEDGGRAHHSGYRGNDNREDRVHSNQGYRGSYRNGHRGNYSAGNHHDNNRGGYRDARSSHFYPPPHHVVPPRVVYRPYGFQRGYNYNHYYGGPVYVVNDYSRYRLRQPPYGHRWIRDDRGNLLMVAIATGIIADLVLRN